MQTSLVLRVLHTPLLQPTPSTGQYTWIRVFHTYLTQRLQRHCTTGCKPDCIDYTNSCTIIIICTNAALSLISLSQHNKRTLVEQSVVAEDRVDKADKVVVVDVAAEIVVDPHLQRLHSKGYMFL